jgi:hypothetical protein
MCEFCENIRTVDFSEETYETLSGGISIDKETGEYCIATDFRSYEYGVFDSLDINYCPICGRDLRSVGNAKD